MSPASLGEFEHFLLLAILRLGEQAYGVSIRAELAKRTGRQVSPGAIYTTLDRLEGKGLLTSTTGEPTPERGGRSKRFYHLTSGGMESLREAHRVLHELWKGLPLHA